MHLILEDADQHDQQIDCHYCQWRGPASDLKKGEYLFLSNITEVFCPGCDKYLGFIQHDTPGEERS